MSAILISLFIPTYHAPAHLPSSAPPVSPAARPELYINYQNNSAALDQLGFAPIGYVVQGLDSVLSTLYDGYGEMADACGLHGFRPCHGPNETQLYAQGMDLDPDPDPDSDRDPESDRDRLTLTQTVT